ncbi:Serine/threonine protein kinase [Planctomycetales bacterium 10988]|nr:Serine/threonine protein kinase [Planctomycetales bacterium 10988]
MAISTTEDFFAHLEKTQLLGLDHLARVQATIAERNFTRPVEVASEMLRRGWLTQWQARQILEGRTKFFLGRYKLLEPIGAGGMGEVFKAEKTPLGVIVALKVLSKDLLTSEEAKARFKREALMVVRLHHDHIVSAHDAFWADDSYFIEMEYVPGYNLSHWLKHYKPLPIDWVCECIRQSALALQYASEQGLVHRDIKPGNLLVVADNPYSPPKVKLLDLGLARVAFEREDLENTFEDTPRGITRDGQVLGTPEYIAPEQITNTKTASVRSDIYSLGCTAFRVITGKFPFEGKNTVEKIRARLHKEPPLMSSVRSEVSEGLDAVIAKMLARDPDERFQTPMEVVHALEPFAYRMAPAGFNQMDSATELPTPTPTPTGNSIPTPRNLPGPDAFEVDSEATPISFTGEELDEEAYDDFSEDTLMGKSGRLRSQLVSVQVNERRFPFPNRTWNVVLGILFLAIVAGLCFVAYQSFNL